MSSELPPVRLFEHRIGRSRAKEQLVGRVVVAMALSVDGYAEGAGGDLSVMPLDETFNVHNAERIREADRVLYGGTTYRQMVGYWPHVPSNPAASEAEQEIARRMADGLPVVAVSDTLTAEDTGPWREQTTLVRRVDAHRVVGGLDGTTLVFGSQTVWADLLAHGLVDELYLMLGPKLVAGDRPVFAGVPTTALRLLDVRTFDDSPAVVLHYAVAAS